LGWLPNVRYVKEMRITIVTPARAGSTHGNRITAIRWACILKQLGHRVSICQTFDRQPADLLIALHARRSYLSIKSFHMQYPDVPIVVALTGTDVYRDLKHDSGAQKALAIAQRIVILQPKALEKLNDSFKGKACVIYQSVEKSRRPSNRSAMGQSFDVCVIGHLRSVKDPFRAAMAARAIPESSRIRILHIGSAMTKAMATRAHAEADRNHRYQWLGELARSRARHILASSQICVLSSRMEGGANVLSEAIVAGVPILASRIDGNVGILGGDYPGLFDVGDTRELARLLILAEMNSVFLSDLRRRVKKLAPLFNPKRERRAWADLLRELAGGPNE
jgi:putative glycosyltransferase (TIGR04348 family)